jgi:hypothetical protein
VSKYVTVSLVTVPRTLHSHKWLCFRHLDSKSRTPIGLVMSSVLTHALHSPICGILWWLFFYILSCLCIHVMCFVSHDKRMYCITLSLLSAAMNTCVFQRTENCARMLYDLRGEQRIVLKHPTSIRSFPVLSSPIIFI